MKLENLIKENPGINLTINAGQLMEFGQSIADQAIRTFLQKHDEKVYSRKEVVDKFGICEATLWRWTRLGLIESKKVGNRVFYPESEIRRLSTHKDK